MERYIGLDAHASSCTLGMVGPSGKRLGSQVVETNARALIEVLRGIPRNRHLCLEEGTLSGWLYEVLKPHVEELTVAGVGKSRGPKTDKLDAFALAEKLRIGSLETTVYKNRGQFRRLGERAKSYDFLVGDTVRVKNRLKSVLRSRGVAYGAGRSVYLKRDREEWLAKLPEASRATAGLLYEEHDALVALRARAEKALLAEARKHREWHVLKTCPGLGPIRTAELLPVVVTPYRFQSRSRFWAYCGLGVVMRSSSDWVRGPGGRWVREPVQQTRGLNRNFNHTLKRVFKGRSDDGDRSGRGRALVPPLRATPGGGHEAESGEADDRASARLDRASGVAHGRSVRPQETGSDGVNRPGIGERGVESGHNMGSDETEANRLQGTASIHTVGRGREPKPPIKGYAPLESRTKRWATESQIEGWFPLQSGERDGCERLPDCDADPASAPLPTLSRRPGNPNHADADGQKISRRRVGKVRLDRQPHRRVCKKRGDAPFRSRVLPLFARRTKELGALLPELYLHGLAEGDFELAMRG